MLRRIELTNIGPFTHWEADHLTTRMLITGNNGDGKSTIRHVFNCMLDDHNSWLIRNGCDEGEILMEFEVKWSPDTGEIDPSGSQTGIVRSRQRIRPGKSTYDIELPNRLKVLKSQKAFLKSLVTGCSLDPMKFVEGSDKERLEYLLSVFPIQFSQAELRPILGPEAALLGTYNLEQFDNLLATQAQKRTEQNAKVDATKGLLTKLEQGLPPAAQDATDWVTEAKCLRNEHLTATQELRELQTGIQSEYDRACQLLKDQTAQTLQDLDRQEAAEIERIRAHYRTLRSEQESLHSEKRDKLEAVARQEAQEKTLPLQAHIHELSVELATAEERAQQHLRNQVQRQNVDDARASLRAESLEATRQKRIIDSLRDLRTTKVSAVGIEGIEVRDGVIYVDGRHYKTQLNETEQKKVAIQVAAEAIKQQPVRMMLMEAGDMNDKHLAWIMDGAASLGIQVFVTKTVTGQTGLKVIPYEEWAAHAAA